MAGKRRGNNEGTIYLRGDGRWTAQVTIANGSRKTLYGKTRAEVQRELTTIRRELDLGLPVQRDGRVRLADWLADWLARVRPSIKPLTHARYGENHPPRARGDAGAYRARQGDAGPG